MTNYEFVNNWTNIVLSWNKSCNQICSPSFCGPNFLSKQLNINISDLSKRQLFTFFRRSYFMMRITWGIYCWRHNFLSYSRLYVVRHCGTICLFISIVCKSALINSNSANFLCGYNFWMASFGFHRSLRHQGVLIWAIIRSSCQYFWWHCYPLSHLIIQLCFFHNVWGEHFIQFGF